MLSVNIFSSTDVNTLTQQVVETYSLLNIYTDTGDGEGDGDGDGGHEGHGGDIEGEVVGLVAAHKEMKPSPRTRVFKKCIYLQKC